MKTLLALFLLSTPAFAQVIPGPQPAKIPAPTATLSGSDWVVTVAGQDYRVPATFDRETAVRSVASVTGGVKAAPVVSAGLRTEYRQVTRYTQVCNGNGTCRLVPHTVTEAVQVPE